MNWKKIKEQKSVNKYVDFCFFLIKRFRYLEINQTAASLTYTTLLSLVPTFIVIILIISKFSTFDQILIRIFQSIEWMLEGQVYEAFQVYIKTIPEKVGHLSYYGILLLTITSLLMIQTVDKVFNSIWQVNKQRHIIIRLFTYISLLLIGSVSIGLVFTFWNMIFKSTVFFEEYKFLSNIIYSLWYILFLTLILFILYKTVPYRFVPVRHAAIGGFLTAISLNFVRLGMGYYIKFFNNLELIYGAFAFLPLFLISIYCLWYVLLGGAILTASLSHWEGEAFIKETKGNNYFDEIIRILVILNESNTNQKLITDKEIRKKINLGYDTIGDLLDSLMAIGLVKRHISGWKLAKQPDEIYIHKLYQHFIYKPKSSENDFISQTIHSYLLPTIKSLTITLKDFISDIEINKNNHNEKITASQRNHLN